MQLAASFPLFDTTDFPARWTCGQWSAVHGWTHILSDLAIFGAYSAIPISILYFVWKRRDVPLNYLFWLFATFIFACGFGHLVEATIFWYPWYRFSALSKVVTATVSWATVVVLIRQLPAALALPGVARLNEELRQEITERTRAEQQLRDAHAALQHAVVAASRLDQQGRYVEINQEYASMLGFTPREMLGQSWEARVHPEDLPLVQAAYQEMLHSGRGEAEVRALRKDGTVFHKLVTMVPAHDAAGAMTGHHHFAQDITERKQAEERLRLVVEAALDAVITIDSAGFITSWNPQAEAIFGWTCREVLGRPLRETIIPERYRQAHERGLQRYLATGEAVVLKRRIELSALRRDGHEFPIELAITPIQTGADVSFSAFVRDITERKRAEDAVKASLAEKETLLKEIHHRVKNNLQVISSILNLQAGYIENAQARVLFGECQDRVRTMALVHEKLYRSPSLSAIDLAEEVRELAAMLATSHSRPGVRLTVEADSTLVGVEIAVPVGLVLNELVSNALKHGFPDGRPGTVQVTLRRREPGRLLMSVRDDGKGLPESFVLDRATSLGLTMIHALARQLGATVDLRREGGTEFVLTFSAPVPTHLERTV